MADPRRGQSGSWRWAGLWDERGELDLAATLGSLPADDRHAAQLIADERPGQIHYVGLTERTGRWYIWDGRCHRPDDGGTAEQVAVFWADRVLELLRECRRQVENRIATGMAGSSADEVARAVKREWAAWEPVSKYHHGLHRSAGHGACLRYLSILPGVRVPEKEMADRHPQWLNCRNGTVDLATMMIKPHDPADMITYCVDHDFVPGARGAGWEALLWHVAGENPAVLDYLVRMLGYSVLGDNRSQLIFFMTGQTNSGKTQVTEAVAGVLGALAHNSTGALIGRSKSERHARVEASLAGKRFVTIDESAERIAIDEGQLKRITGSSVIGVNRLYAITEIEVRVAFTIWQSANEMPTMSGFDDAIRRRVRAIPCGATVPPEQRVDRLGEKLAAAEGEAILAMLIWGACAYLAAGEQCPPEVELATAEYEAEQDTAASFRAECCMDVPQWNGQMPEVSQAEMRREYVAWCAATRTPMLPKHAFNKRFSQLPGVSWDLHNKRYRGIQIIESYVSSNGQDGPG
jgi:P4 family phage/plasmid primase-like protien